MTHSGACPDCLRRAWLLGLAAPYIERAIGAARNASALELFCLSNEALAEAVAPKVAAVLVARVEALPESHFTDELGAAECWAICRHDPHYPQPLREAPGAPGALIARGDPALMAAFEPSESVALVVQLPMGERRLARSGATSRPSASRSSAISPSASTPAPFVAPWTPARPSPSSAPAPTSPIRRPIGTFGGESPKTAWLSLSCRPAPALGAGPSRPARGSWRRLPE